MKRYEASLVRDIVTTEPSATNSVRRTETAIVTIETADDFNPDHGPDGYNLLGEWRIVSNVRKKEESSR